MESFLTPYDLSNSGKEKLQFPPFWGGPKLGCSDGLRAEIVESYNFFVLCPILLKLHILTRLIDSFPMVQGSWSCIEIEMLITPGAHDQRPWIERALSAVIFQSYVLSCWKLHISTQVIDSFPLPYSPKSCDKEKLSIPLEPHHNAQSSEIFLNFLPKKLKEL